ncbi:COX15/CtaA family protein [Kordiimonas pumila]|uniref:Heme A synthase n=1 Tax=Kordiimonas pumila TaxID=2161677 RepID=A0ABV7D1H0_9PROT|nr:COX15/CtaA family protein [Kordiimonas pumila]
MVFQTTDKNRRFVGYWLLVMAAMVFAMVVVGGATRLTESGLSMVNWNPVTGVLPPLTEQSWRKEFSDYKHSPEYKLKNAGMSLEDFKGIYYWEWGHRLLGRIIGIFFLLPFLYFWMKGIIPQGYKRRLIILFILGGGQGLLGWYMVMSGLIDEPAVSHYRLTAHLGLALVIFSALYWTALSLLNPHPTVYAPAMKGLTHMFMAGLVAQLLMGGLVAGLKAGHIFNTWPHMGDTYIPEGLLMMEPIWRNFLDNAITVQFDHRIGAYILFALAIVLFFLSRLQGGAIRKAATFLMITILAQIAVGIVMLLENVPVSWGTLHQGGGVIVLAATLTLMHTMRRKEAL